MSGKNTNFNDKKIKKVNFAKKKKKKVNSIDDIDVNKILVSRNKPYGIKISFKYFVRYNDNYIIRPLCV